MPCGREPNSGQRSPNRLEALVWALTELVVTTNSGFLDVMWSGVL